MKAMILAAGLGTRLLPFTQNTPKPLFPISGRPILDIIIHSLQQAGCKSIIINTHHLQQKIDSFLAKQKYTIPVVTRYEPTLLGTGGAIKNVMDFWDGNPFLVINSDIISDIDLEKVYAYHLNHPYPVTMVLHDDPEINTVSVSEDNFIIDFHGQEIKSSWGEEKTLTFTGIQVLDPEVLSFIPANTFSSIIDAYRKLMLAGKKIKVYYSKNNDWKDIGTPERYKEAVYATMAPEAFKKAGSDYRVNNIKRVCLKGDGSDRIWYRLTAEPESGEGSGVNSPDAREKVVANRSLVMVDHGIKKQSTASEIDAFVTIGRHLQNSGIPVPEIYLHDTFSGWAFMEDLGDLNLQETVQKTRCSSQIYLYYQSVIDLLVEMSISAAKGFDPSWTYQTACYDRNLIIEKECRYFVDSFLRGYLGLDPNFEDLRNEFISLADRALEFSVTGFMHRDMQSRNIMVKNKRFYFIDFQGGRIGPIQYDLASLLIDPYVALPYPLQVQLLNYCIDRLSAFIRCRKNNFSTCFKFCSITRNLQILGAFGYLSRTKGKTYFEKFIPTALTTLKHNLFALKGTEFPKLKKIVEKISKI